MNEYALKDLRAVKQLLDNLNVEFTLGYGVCLGAYRDKEFLPDDDDIDLVITQELSIEMRQRIADELMDIGFKAQKMYWIVQGRKVDDVADYQGNEKTGIIVVERYFKLTIFFFYEENGEMICIPHDRPLISSLSKFYKKLGKIKFKGDSYLVPTPTGEYLTWVYGNWKDKTLRNHGKLYDEIHN